MNYRLVGTSNEVERRLKPEVCQQTSLASDCGLGLGGVRWPPSEGGFASDSLGSLSRSPGGTVPAPGSRCSSSWLVLVVLILLEATTPRRPHDSRDDVIFSVC